MPALNLGAAANDGTGTSLRAAGAILNDTGLRKNNWTATTAPGASNDSTQGYEVGSAWLNATTGDLYIARVVTSGAADWVLQMSSSGGSSLPAKSTLAAADQVLILDSAASDAPKKTPATEFRRETLIIAVSDETTALTTGAGKITFRMPWAMTLTAVRASVNTAPVGSTLIVDINEGGVSILSTNLSIDASEKTSTTAASAAVISDASLADDAEITIDIDQIGSSTAGAGLKVYLIGYRA